MAGFEKLGRSRSLLRVGGNQLRIPTITEVVREDDPRRIPVGGVIHPLVMHGVVSVIVADEDEMRAGFLLELCFTSARENG